MTVARVVPATDAAVRDAAEELRRGGVVAFPTETVYGLGGDTFNAKALATIYRLKGRPRENPLIAHVLDAAQARKVAAWDDRAGRLAERFWPGPLTIVLPKTPAVPAAATGGRGTVAVRAPSHPVARALLESFGGAISAPSANRSGHVSPTSAAHVAADFADEPDLAILDGGASPLGIESTVVSLASDVPAVLRPGAVSVEELRDTLGRVDTPEIDAQDASPGTTRRHYAPRARTEIVDREGIRERLRRASGPVAVLLLHPPDEDGGSGEDSATSEGEDLLRRVIPMPRDATAYAARLYAALREADATGPDVILIERPPTDVPIDAPLWSAIHDRLRRATAEE